MSDAAFLFALRGGFDATVIDSQVVDTIMSVRPYGVHFSLVAFTDGSTYLGQREFLKRRRAEIAVRIGGRVSAHLSPRQGLASGNAIGMAYLLYELARAGSRRVVLHARGDGPGFYASRVRRVWPGLRYVYDVRGDSEAEFRQHPEMGDLAERKHAWHLERIARERRLAVAGAAHVLCVSSVLRDRLLEQHGIPPERITVVPCVADVEKFHVDERERNESRRALGLGDRFVIVYPGRFGRWHYGPETLRVVRGLLDAFPDAFFLCLTPDIDEARRLAGSMLPEGRYRIETARHAEVPRYLRAADLGLLLRERHPLNEAACPTKFAEYMLCGLPVLISPGIGDCSSFVAKQAAGAILEEPDPAAAVEAVRALRKEPDEARRARIGAASGELSRQRLARELADLYLRLAHES